MGSTLINVTPRIFVIGPWTIHVETGRIQNGDNEKTLEPRQMALLSLLASDPGRVFARDAIETAIWGKTIVGEDTVARTVSRLRKALDDQPSAPVFIETLPKRGYRLIATVETHSDEGAPASKKNSAPRWPIRMAAVVVASALVALAVYWLQPMEERPYDLQLTRADDLYMRFTREDNEAAIGLYERVLSEAPDNAQAQAGLANALVQRVIRWPRAAGMEGATSLSEALQRGITSRPEADAILSRAVAMAERAVRLAPNDPDTMKALAFTLTANGELERAEAIYREIITIAPAHWPALINLGEINSIRGDREAALTYFVDAWNAMTDAYQIEPQRVGPWQTALGVGIGQQYETLGARTEAELWYRRVLVQAPYEPEATVGLARLLTAAGESGEARALCQGLVERLGPYPGCDAK
ncbi:MAG: winged helix-turn-helix domain-containing protein [Pseudomonadota bacterium]